jgi:hypothetical protein
MAGQLLITVPSAANELTPASSAFADTLAAFPIVWSTFIIVICSGAVSSEAGVVADSILSKAVTRYHYILAKFSSRLVAMVSVYALVAVTTAYLLAQNAEDDFSTAGVVWGILSVGMMVTLLTSLSISFSTLFERTLVALVVVWVIWYVAGGLLALFQLEFLSPIDIMENMPATLRGDYETGDQIKIVGVFGLLSVGTVWAAVMYFARKDL